MSLEKAIRELNANVEKLNSYFEDITALFLSDPEKAVTTAQVDAVLVKSEGEKPKTGKTTTTKKKTAKKTADTVETITVDSVRAKLVELKKAGGDPTKVLKSVKVAKLSELLPAHYPKVIETANTMLENMQA